MKQSHRMAAELAIPDNDDVAGALVAACWPPSAAVHTRAACLLDLAQWGDWLAGHGVPLLKADETAAAMWPAIWRPQGVKDGTAARKLTAVSSFYGVPGADALVEHAPEVAVWTLVVSG